MPEIFMIMPMLTDGCAWDANDWTIPPVFHQRTGAADVMMMMSLPCRPCHSAACN